MLKKASSPIYRVCLDFNQRICEHLLLIVWINIYSNSDSRTMHKKKALNQITMSSKNNVFPLHNQFAEYCFYFSANYHMSSTILSVYATFWSLKPASGHTLLNAHSLEMSLVLTRELLPAFWINATLTCLQGLGMWPKQHRSSAEVVQVW